MIVAWHEVPGKGATMNPSRRARSESYYVKAACQVGTIARRAANHTVPYGTDPFYHLFQALRARLLSFGPCGTNALNN
jgi:hypothetical protein